MTVFATGNMSMIEESKKVSARLSASHLPWLTLVAHGKRANVIWMFPFVLAADANTV